MPKAESARKTETPLIVLIVLDIAVVGVIGIMLMTPVSPNKGSLFPLIPGEIGALGKLLCFPIQWLLALMVVGIGMGKIKGDEIRGSVIVFGFGIPLGSVGLTLLFFPQIMRF